MLELTVGYCGGTINLHDVYFVASGEEIVDIWRIRGRGPGWTSELRRGPERARIATSLGAWLVNDRPVAGGVELRLSGVLAGALRMRSIMTEGQARGHTERSCLIGMRLGAALDLDDDERSSLFYALLLKDAGCSSNAARVAALFGADDAMVKSSRRLTDTSSTAEALWHVLRTAGAGGSVLEKPRRVVAVLRSGRAGAAAR